MHGMGRRPKTNPAIKRLMPLMNSYFTRRFGAKEGAEKSAGTIRIAQRYWDETPYIGGGENLLSGNLYMSEVLFAAVEACGRDFPGEDILALGEELAVGRIKKLCRFVNTEKIVSRKWAQKLLYRIYGGYIRKREKNGWDSSWRLEINPYGHKDGFAWRFTSCPIAEFAKEHDMLPWMKYLCQLDHLMTEAAGCRLIRKHTIASSGDECDYWIVGGGETRE